MDASFRLQTNQLESVYRRAQRNGGIVFFTQGMKVTAGSNPVLFRYIVSDELELGQVPMPGGDGFIRNTRAVYEGVMYWWFLCALEPDCIEPLGSTVVCRNISYSSPAYIGCHRYDQSVLDTLVSNFYKFNKTEFVDPNLFKGKSSVRFVRKKTSNYPIQVCHKSENK